MQLLYAEQSEQGTHNWNNVYLQIRQKSFWWSALVRRSLHHICWTSLWMAAWTRQMPRRLQTNSTPWSRPNADNSKRQSLRVAAMKGHGGICYVRLRNTCQSFGIM